MKTAGYSGTPLAKKLGLKEGLKIRLINQPEYYFELFVDLPENIKIITDKKVKKISFIILPKNLTTCRKTSLRYEMKLKKTELFGFLAQKNHQKCSRI